MVPVWAVAGAAAPLQGENRKGNLPMPLNALSAVPGTSLAAPWFNPCDSPQLSQ